MASRLSPTAREITAPSKAIQRRETANQSAVTCELGACTLI